ncbi:MAG: hypothetical protein II949_15080 [Prevotella sp.]|nr:hypothetical protein [Prevotella sp.]
MNKDNILGASAHPQQRGGGGRRCLAPDTGPSGQRAGTKATGRRRNVGNGPAPTLAASPGT